MNEDYINTLKESLRILKADLMNAKTRAEALTLMHEIKDTASKIQRLEDMLVEE